MKTIKLTQGQIALVDDEDFDRLNGFRWSVTWNKHTKSFNATRSSPRVNGKRHTIRMHREILNAKLGEEVDHINHDTVDNRRENLRLCSTGQNCVNRRRRVDNTSGFKGVSWDNGHGKWRSRLMVNRKPHYLGRFATALEAAIAYDRAARDEFGEFALTNQMLGLIMVEISSNQPETEA